MIQLLTLLIVNSCEQISIGGLRSFSGVRGVSVQENFSGCIENIYMNELNMLRDYTNQAASLANNDVIGFYTGSISRYTFFGI